MVKEAIRTVKTIEIVKRVSKKRFSDEVHDLILRIKHEIFIPFKRRGDTLSFFLELEQLYCIR